MAPKRVVEDIEKPTLESLLISNSNGLLVSASSEVFYEENLQTREAVLHEVKRQLMLAGPLIVGSLLQMTLQVISIMFVGHLGELQLSGASMATSFAGVTGFSLMSGFASALEMLCGQAFGAKEYHMLGIYIQRAMLVLIFFGIPVSFIWFFTGPILLLFGQDSEIANEAGLYARWMIPSIFAYGLLQCHVRFLQAQNIVLPMMLSSGITALLHILLCWSLVYQFGLGNKGAALANCISYWTNMLLLHLYVRLSPDCKISWIGFSKEAFCDLQCFIKLAIPSATMVCLGFWSFELVVLLSGLLPNPKLETSVLSISLNTATTVYMIASGLGAAVSTRVSNELGAGHPRTTLLAIKVVISLAVAEGLLIGAIMILLRQIWGYAYSNEDEVVNYVAAMLPIIAVSNFFDGIQAVLSGVARGCGWQKIGTCINLGSFYLVGIPSAVLLAFVLHIGGKGLWMGIICGIFVQITLFATITIRANWEKEVLKARERVLFSALQRIQ